MLFKVNNTLCQRIRRWWSCPSVKQKNFWERNKPTYFSSRKMSIPNNNKCLLRICPCSQSTFVSPTFSCLRSTFSATSRLTSRVTQFRQQTRWAVWRLRALLLYASSRLCFQFHNRITGSDDDDWLRIARFAARSAIQWNTKRKRSFRGQNQNQPARTSGSEAVTHDWSWFEQMSVIGWARANNGKRESCRAYFVCKVCVCVVSLSSLPLLASHTQIVQINLIKVSIGTSRVSYRAPRSVSQKGLTKSVSRFSNTNSVYYILIENTNFAKSSLLFKKNNTRFAHRFVTRIVKPSLDCREKHVEIETNLHGDFCT